MVAKMGEIGVNRIFVFFAFFYTILFGLMAIFQFTDLTYNRGSPEVAYGESYFVCDALLGCQSFVCLDAEGCTADFNAVLCLTDDIYCEETDDLKSGFLNNLTTNFNAIPDILNIIIFIPLGMLAGYWLIIFAIKILHG